MKICIVNGPNLNLLGTREPEIYGRETLKDLENKIQKEFSDKAELTFFQSNSEGELIDFIHSQRDAWFVINAGAYTHTSIALRDALEGIKARFIEVHISNVHAREEFRHHSKLSDIAEGVIIGLGLEGYRLAVLYILGKN